MRLDSVMSRCSRHYINYDSVKASVAQWPLGRGFASSLKLLDEWFCFKTEDAHPRCGLLLLCQLRRSPPVSHKELKLINNNGLFALRIYLHVFLKAAMDSPRVTDSLEYKNNFSIQAGRGVVQVGTFRNNVDSKRAMNDETKIPAARLITQRRPFLWIAAEGKIHDIHENSFATSQLEFNIKPPYSSLLFLMNNVSIEAWIA